jgi:hypothetical protein
MPGKDKIKVSKAMPLDYNDSDVFLNNISVQLGKLLNSQSEQIQMLKQQTDALKQQTVVMSSQQNTLSAILKELSDYNDGGDYLIQQGTATTDLSQNIIDLLGLLGYPIKGYVIKNDGANTIEIGHNITPSVIDSNLQTVTGKFYPLFAHEEHKEMFNRKVIRNIYMRTDTGSSAYRLWLLW